MINQYKKELTKSSVYLIIFTTITSMFISATEFIGPLLIRNFVDNYNLDKFNISTLIWILVTFICCYIFKVFLNRMKNNYSVVFKTKESKKLIGLMFKMKYLELNKLEPTYLIEKITYTIDTLFSLYAETIAAFIIAIITIIGCIIFMIFVEPMVAVMFIIIIPIQIFGYKKLNKKLSDICVKLQTINAKSFTNIISIASAVDYIKQSSDPKHINDMLGKFLKTIYGENAKVNKFAGVVSITLSDIISILSNGIYIYVTILLITSKLTLSDFIFTSLINSIFFPALNRIVGANINLRDLKGVYSFVEEELLSNLEIDGTKILEKIENIDFDIKSIGYNDNELISDVDMKIFPGDVVMIKGESGCGKSTLVKGLIKFLDLENIKINGNNIREYKNSALRNKISFFSQNVPIVTGTIKENILLGAEKDDNLLDKIKDKEFMKKFYEYPDGLETKIFENGSNLSGGDKQKIAIARIFIEDPDVVILDEITSSIDRETAEVILGDIVNSYKDKMIFIISHDANVEKYASKVYEIKDKKWNMIINNEV